MVEGTLRRLCIKVKYKITGDDFESGKKNRVYFRELSVKYKIVQFDIEHVITNVIYLLFVVVL